MLTGPESVEKDRVFNEMGPANPYKELKRERERERNKKKQRNKT